MNKDYEIEIPDEQAMRALGARLSTLVSPGVTLFLKGDLGAGKTTLVRGFLRAMGHHEAVKSPTYTMVEPYDIAGKTIYHFDLYRLVTPEELDLIGIRDYFSHESICLVEWPENGQGVLPLSDLTCTISIEDTGRIVSLEQHTSKGAAILKHWDTALR